MLCPETLKTYVQSELCLVAECGGTGRDNRWPQQMEECVFLCLSVSLKLFQLAVLLPSCFQRTLKLLGEPVHHLILRNANTQYFNS